MAEASGRPSCRSWEGRTATSMRSTCGASDASRTPRAVRMSAAPRVRWTRIPALSQRGSRQRQPGGEIGEPPRPDDPGGVVTEVPGDHGRVVGEGRRHGSRPAVGRLQHQRVGPGVAGPPGSTSPSLSTGRRVGPPCGSPPDGAAARSHREPGQEHRDDPQAAGSAPPRAACRSASRRLSTPRASGMKLSQASPTRTWRKPASAIRVRSAVTAAASKACQRKGPVAPGW